MSGVPPQAKPKIRVVQEPKHTDNMFGPIEEIAGKELEVISKNPDGDCMCIFKGVKGQNLVDVDHRDIEQNAAG